MAIEALSEKWVVQNNEAAYELASKERNIEKYETIASAVIRGIQDLVNRWYKGKVMRRFSVQQIHRWKLPTPLKNEFDELCGALRRIKKD